MYEIFYTFKGCLEQINIDYMIQSLLVDLHITHIGAVQKNWCILYLCDYMHQKLLKKLRKTVFHAMSLVL